jgi:hypothetical protein
VRKTFQLNIKKLKMSRLPPKFTPVQAEFLHHIQAHLYFVEEQVKLMRLALEQWTNKPANLSNLTYRFIPKDRGDGTPEAPLNLVATESVLMFCHPTKEVFTQTLPSNELSDSSVDLPYDPANISNLESSDEETGEQNDSLAADILKDCDKIIYEKTL